jgi:hypothetical protein
VIYEPLEFMGKLAALVLPFIIAVTYAPSAVASDARSEAAGDAGTSSRPSDNADEATPPAPEGLVGSSKNDLHQEQEPTSMRHRNYERQYLVPPPRFNLVRYSGVLAPSSGLRCRIISVKPAMVRAQSAKERPGRRLSPFLKPFSLIKYQLD